MKDNIVAVPGMPKNYCLGYYVRECQRMAYKNSVKLRDYYNWRQDKWEAAKTQQFTPYI